MTDGNAQVAHSYPDIASDALDRIWDIVHTPSKATNHRSAERHFMADFDAIRQIIKDIRTRAPAQEVPSHIEKTEAGIIDWKMEVERLNRLLRAAEATAEPDWWRWRFLSRDKGWSKWIALNNDEVSPFRDLQAHGLEAGTVELQALAITSTDRLCAKYGCTTKGEEALVNGEIWCHPCADDADTLRSALKPFAAVAESDIGQDETDADIFQPMRSGYNREPLITVGDMRRAALALSSTQSGGGK